LILLLLRRRQRLQVRLHLLHVGSELGRDLLATRAELGLAKLRIAELEVVAAELATVKGSQAYRAARLLGNSRAKLLRR